MTPGASLPWFYSKTREVRKIIVVDLGFLGDSVHLTPALREIKRHYPKAALHVLTTELGGALLELVDDVDKLWIMPNRSRSPAWYRNWGLIRNLRREGFDLAMNFSGSDRTVIFTALTGAKWRVSRVGSRWHFWSSWLVRWWVRSAPGNEVLPVYDERRQFLTALGFQLAPARFDFSISPEARQRADARGPGKAVHFSINASGPLAEWPVESWAALVRGLRERWPDLLLLATSSPSARETARLERFKSLVPSAGVMVLSGLKLVELAALIGRSAVHVGSDSGALHLAAALGTKTISFFRLAEDPDPKHPRGPAHLERWRPRGPGHLQLKAVCRCAALRTPVCVERAECLAGISVASVLDAVCERL